jgi:exopolysaccharide biosynthesis polyprenyl glycosylphosphotransferase
MGKLVVYSEFSEAISRIRQLDEIIQADSALDPDQVLEMVNYASQSHVAFRFVPNQFGLYATHSSITTMAGIPVIELARTPLQGWGRIIKRGFDLIGSILGLIVLSPLFILAALLIKITDPGKVFYSQRRLSRFGKPVMIYKFRTMMMKYSTGEQFGGLTNEETFRAMGRADLIAEFKKENKLANDPRVSRIGKFMRRTSIDELPQLFNVLLGHLSLVGPRPMLEDELERYGENLPQVLSLRCGLTGLWQVSGRTDIGFEGRVKLDLYYVENWSLGMDIRILFKTLKVVFSRRGAY